MASYPLIDIYCHIYPEKFFEEMTKLSPQTQNLGKRLRTVTKLFDLNERFREMDQFGDYRQVISLPNPPIEELAAGESALQLARIAAQVGTPYYLSKPYELADLLELVARVLLERIPPDRHLPTRSA